VADMADGYVTVFLRVPKGVKDVLEETVRGMNEARQIGERMHSVNEVVTRCVVDVLSPAFDRAGRDLATALRGVKRDRVERSKRKHDGRTAAGRMAKPSKPSKPSKTRKALPSRKRGGMAAEVTRG